MGKSFDMRYNKLFNFAGVTGDYGRSGSEEVWRLIEISLLTGELFFTVLWVLSRGMIWIQQKKIGWKREAFLLLMYINLAVLIRFVFYPFFTVNGQVQPLILNVSSIQPLRVNLIQFVNILDYDIKREATINIIGNISMFIPTGIIMPFLYKRLDCFWKVLLAGAGLSFAIEMIQLLFPGSVTDIDDLILNTAGVAIGYGIYKLVNHSFRKALISVFFSPSPIPGGSKNPSVLLPFDYH